jgi:hypothetical protein
MNWIEKICGVSPDGGNGATELLLVLGVTVVGTMAWIAARRLVAARRGK